jgi:cephalosporin hydroxylase
VNSSEAEALVAVRSFDNDIGPSTWDAIQDGTLACRYRGRRFLKSPFDQALYGQLMERLRPQTVIEVGVFDGGSALWFADSLRARGINPTIVGVERAELPDVSDPALRLLQGDALDLGRTLTNELLATLPHPWMIIEDSAHVYETSLATLEFFAPRMSAGDYIVVEDGIIRSLPGEYYAKLNDGPNRAVDDFLSKNPGVFEIDADLCDFFGYNVTYNPNGWLVRR